MKSPQSARRRLDPPPERGTKYDAASILGIRPRTVTELALLRKLPGAARIGGQWTFDLAKLRQYVADKEREACRNDEPQKAASGAKACFGGAHRSAAATSNGRYAQTTRKLRDLAARRAETVS